MPPAVGVGVAGVIFKGSALLMLQRSGSHGAGTWSVPGGWVDAGESLEQAVEREVWEETGLSVEAIYVFDYTRDSFLEGVEDVCFWIICEIKAGQPEIKEPDKCQALRWMPWETIEKRDDLFLPMRQVCDAGLLKRFFTYAYTQGLIG